VLFLLLSLALSKSVLYAQMLSISPIADVTTPAGTPVRVSFTITDANPAAAFVLAFAANTDLVPDNGISVEGSGTQRTLVITPAAGRSGSTSIAVNVTSFSGQNQTRTFTLTVTGGQPPPMPRAPVLQGIPTTLTTQSNTPVSVPFSVQDENLATLTFAASSTNETLLPPANVSVTGAGNSRTLTLTPARDRVGSATITLTVRDQDGLTAQSPVMLTVNPVQVMPPPPTGQNPPVIGVIADLVTPQNQTVRTEFSLQDADPSTVRLSVNSSNPQLINPANVGVSIAGGNAAVRTLAITPTSGQFGSATLTLVATNSANLSSQRTVTVTVVAPPTFNPLVNLTTTTGTAVSSTFTASPENGNPLTFAVRSSNTALLPAENITISGLIAPNQRVLRLVPEANQIGTAQVTITANNGFLTATRSLTLTVLPPPEPPADTASTRPVPPAPPASTIPRAISPADDTTTVLANGLELRWTPVTNASAYHVELSPDPSFDFVLLSAPFVTDTQLVVGNLETNRAYYWRVRARFGFGAGVWSPTFSFRTAPLNAPGNPFGFSVLPNAAGTHHEAECSVQMRLSPKPSEGVVQLEYTLAEPTTMRIDLYDTRGFHVAELVNAFAERGKHQVLFTPPYSQSTSVWIVVLRTANRIVTERCVVER